MRRSLRILFVAGAILGVAAPAQAQPAQVPVQGTLTDSNDIPLEGTHTVVFAVYAVQTGGTALFQETHTLSVEQGAFTAYLGSISSLDLGLFDGAQLYLGIKVGSDPEMTPRLPFGSVPYAAYARETAAVPTGAVMTFDLASCPAGWSELTAARGRALVGLPAAGVLKGTVGTALANQENRTHAHSVNVGAFDSAAAAVPHTHSVDPPSTTSASDTHGHRWTSGAVTFDSAGNSVVPLLVRLNGTGASFYAVSGTGSNYTDRYQHSHSLDVASFDSGAATTTSHLHTIDPPANTSTTAATADVIPYIQLLVCRKN